MEELLLGLVYLASAELSDNLCDSHASSLYPTMHSFITQLASWLGCKGSQAITCMFKFLPAKSHFGNLLIMHLNQGCLTPACRQNLASGMVSFGMHASSWVYGVPCKPWPCTLDQMCIVAQGQISVCRARQRQCRIPKPNYGMQGQRRTLRPNPSRWGCWGALVPAPGRQGLDLACSLALHHSFGP